MGMEGASRGAEGEKRQRAQGCARHVIRHLFQIVFMLLENDGLE